MDKDSGHYCYESYPSVTKSNTNSLKPSDSKKKKKEVNSCNCFSSKKRKAFLTGLATNLGICILLFAYTLIGSFIFLAIEGGNAMQHQILATTSMATNMNYSNKKQTNGSYELKSKADEVRAQTVENIWDITVKLNILYKDNWTSLAAQEITKFQDELLKTLSEENFQEHPIVESKTSGKMTQENFEWTFARSFLYSLTVLTTIETLRKYPAATAVNRKCTKDYQLPESDTILQTGMRVVIPIYALHHDPEYYPKPQIFDPERFNDANKAKRHPFTYLPFGEGPRSCIGMRFGLLQTKVGLLLLLKNCRFSLNAKTPVPLIFDSKSLILASRDKILLDAELIQTI